MPRTNILAVDDDQTVLDSVERDLRQKYGRDFRIIKATSGAAAIDVVRQLRQREESVALFVVDQRMPKMSGLEFLEEAAKAYPEARKVPLTAYADTEAAINAINKVGLDYYMTKPWHPPEDNFYPVLDTLLDEWKRNAQVPFEGVRVNRRNVVACLPRGEGLPRAQLRSVPAARHRPGRAGAVASAVARPRRAPHPRAGVP